MATSFVPLCPGITVSDEGDTLTIKVQKDKAPRASASGKSLVIASTRGNQTLNGMKIGINIYTDKPQA